MPSDPNLSTDAIDEDGHNERESLHPAKNYKFVVKVTALERVGSATNQRENPVIIFDLYTDATVFRKRQHRGIKKTTEEFKELFRYLVAAVQGTFVPSLPNTCSSYGPNTDEDRRKTMKNYQEWLERVGSDSLLLENEELAFFVQSDFGTYSPINNPPAPPASGLKRRTLKQLAPPYDEVIELAEFRPLVRSIYRLAQEVQSKLSKASRQRRLLSQQETALGQGFIALQNEKLHSHAGLYKKFGRILTAAGDVNSVESTFELATFADAMGWLVKDTYVVKEALTNRHLIMRELLQAQQSSRVKQENARKLRAKRDASPLKVDDALRSLRAATQWEQDLTTKQCHVTNKMLTMRSQWLQWYESFVTYAIKEFTLRKIEYERKKLTLLERVRHDVRRADHGGGLSRLGRESYPQSLSRSPPRTSQGVEGDDWAGDQRRHSSLLIQHDSITNTDFDSSPVAYEEGRTLDPTMADCLTTAENTPYANSAATIKSSGEHNEYNVEVASLDARNAASLLGLATF